MAHITRQKKTLYLQWRLTTSAAVRPAYSFLAEVIWQKHTRRDMSVSTQTPATEYAESVHMQGCRIRKMLIRISLLLSEIVLTHSGIVV